MTYLRLPVVDNEVWKEYTFPAAYNEVTDSIFHNQQTYQSCGESFIS